MSQDARAQDCLLPLREWFLAITFTATILHSGCAHFADYGRGTVEGSIIERTGCGHGFGSACETAGLPPGADLEDGLGEDEAILIALWRNAAFQEVLVDLDLTRADLLQARLLPNPELWYLNPVGVKQLEYALEFPLEILWLRPLRIRSARLENERTCERLVQSGLNLMRDVRQAYADLLLAQGRLAVAEESVRLRQQVADMAAARLKAGDAGPPEAAAARIDFLQAQQDRLRVRQDVTLADQRLRNLLGLPQDCTLLTVHDLLPEPGDDLPAAPYLALEAMQQRPDALAANLAVDAAAERIRLARCSWLRFSGIVDANGSGLKGHEIGPGFRIALPIFNQGQGLVARAEAEHDRSLRQRETLHQQIALDVHRAMTQYEQASAELDYLNRKVQPEVDAAIRRADRAYREGNASYLLVLEATRQLLDSQLRTVQLQAELRRSWAELERSVGRRLTGCPAPAILDAPERLPAPPEKDALP